MEPKQKKRRWYRCGKIKNKTTEIKTARLGNGGSKSFQHELGEYPWKADYMIFIVFNRLYIILRYLKIDSEEFYKKSGKDKSIKCIPYSHKNNNSKKR